MFKSIKKFLGIFFGLKKKEICDAYDRFISMLMDENLYIRNKWEIYNWPDIKIIAVCFPLLILKIVCTFMACVIFLATIAVLGWGVTVLIGLYSFYWWIVFSESLLQYSIIAFFIFLGLFVFAHLFIYFIVSNVVKAYKIMKEQK